MSGPVSKAGRTASPVCEAMTVSGAPLGTFTLIYYFRDSSRGATIPSAAASEGFRLQSPGFGLKCRDAENVIAATPCST